MFEFIFTLKVLYQDAEVSNILIVTIRTKPYCINKKSREIIRETFYNNKESSILFLQMGYLHEDFVVHT